MWILNFLPDSFIHLILLLGLIGLFAAQFFGFIPFLKQFKLQIQLVSFVIVLFGIYMEGALSNEEAWRVKIAEQNVKIAKIEAESSSKTVEVITKYMDRVTVVKGKTNVIIEKIPEFITKEVDASCNIPDSIRLLHNAAAANEVPETARNIDESASGETTTARGK